LSCKKASPKDQVPGKKNPRQEERKDCLHRERLLRIDHQKNRGRKGRLDRETVRPGESGPIFGGGGVKRGGPWVKKPARNEGINYRGHKPFPGGSHPVGYLGETILQSPHRLRRCGEKSTRTGKALLKNVKKSPPGRTPRDREGEVEQDPQVESFEA